MFESLSVLVFMYERLNCFAFKKLLCRASAMRCTHLSIQTWGLSIDSKHFMFSSKFSSKTLCRSPFGIETFVIRFDMPYSIELLMPEALKYKRVIFPGSMLKKIFLHFPEVEQWNFHQISLKKNMSKILVQNVPVDNRYFLRNFLLFSKHPSLHDMLANPARSSQVNYTNKKCKNIRCFWDRKLSRKWSIPTDSTNLLRTNFFQHFHSFKDIFSFAHL